MRIPSPRFFHHRPARHRQRGVAVIVILAILSLILLAMAVNFRSLQALTRELGVLEHKQVHRLNTVAPTNSPPPQPSP